MNIDGFRESLSNGQLVTVMIPVFEEFYEPVDGTVLVPEAPILLDGNHAITLVGFDDAKGRFLFRNSWGQDWGSEGHAYLPYDFVAVHAVDAATVPLLPSKDSTMADSAPRFVATKASDVHHAALNYTSCALENVVLQFPASGLDPKLVESYPFRYFEETPAQALAEIVKWWQHPVVPSGPAKRFNHGSRLRGRDDDWNQIPQIVKALKNDPKSTKGHATLQSHRPDYAHTHGHPSMCEVFFALRHDGERQLLDVTATFRKLELRYWWIVNVHELASLQRVVIEGLAKGDRSIVALPGDITTFAFRAVIAPEGAAPQVAIHALDRMQLFRPNAVSELAVCLTKNPPKADKYQLWEGLLKELVPSERMNQDGFPICIDGLRALAGHVKLLAETSADEGMKLLSTRLMEVLDANKAMVIALDEDKSDPVGTREYTVWKDNCRSLIADSLQLVRRLMRLPGTKGGLP